MSEAQGPESPQVHMYDGCSNNAVVLPNKLTRFSDFYIKSSKMIKTNPVISPNATFSHPFLSHDWLRKISETKHEKQQH